MPQETSFDKHRHPEQSRIVHEAKQIDRDLGHQEDDPEEYEGSSVQRESHSDAFSVPVVVGQYGRDHCGKGDDHHTYHIDLKAQSKARRVISFYKPLKSEEKNALYHQFSEGLRYGFWEKNKL